MHVVSSLLGVPQYLFVKKTDVLLSVSYLFWSLVHVNCGNHSIVLSVLVIYRRHVFPVFSSKYGDVRRMVEKECVITFYEISGWDHSNSILLVRAILSDILVRKKKKEKKNTNSMLSFTYPVMDGMPLPLQENNHVLWKHFFNFEVEA